MSNSAPVRPVAAVQVADAPLLQPTAADASDAVPAMRGAGQALATPPGASPTPWLDAHGYDGQAYDWYPILRRPRADGWTPAKQRLFIETLADTASPKQAADAVGMSRSSAYKLRRSPGGEGFAAAWDSAIQQASKRLVDIAFERAVDGVEEPVLDPDGNLVGHKTRYNDRLLMFLLRAHQPDRYRHASRETRAPDERPAPALPPVADAVRVLEPAPPERPEDTMTPEELEDRVMLAECGQGQRPSYHDPAPRPEPEPTAEDRARDARIDAILDQARRENNPGWDPDAIRRQAEEEEEIEREERRNRRARRAARSRARRCG